MKKFKNHIRNQSWLTPGFLPRRKLTVRIRQAMRAAASLTSRLPFRFSRRSWNLQDSWHYRQRRKTTARLALLLLLATVLGATGVLTFHLLGYSEIFRISNVTIHGNSLIREHQIREAADLENNASLLTVNTEKLAARIAEHPWIREVQVKKKWPSSLMINVCEYQPLALVNLGGEGRQRLFYVDSAGVLFAPVTTARDIDFPVITGSPDRPSPRDHRLKLETPAGLALKFLQMARKSYVLPVQAISEIHVQTDGRLILYLVDRPFPIQLGQADMKKKFFRLTKILQDLYSREEFDHITEINLDYGDNQVLVAKTDR